jgi:hypothetical protein
VVETSPHSLIAKYGGSGRRSAREGPVSPFSERAMPEFSTSRSLHAIARHLMNQLLPLLEPRAVKMASVRGARSS